MTKKWRIRLSRILAGLLLVLICVSGSLWEDKAPFLTMVLFLFGAVLVGIASLGRVWSCAYIAGYKTDHLVTQGPYSMCRNPLYFFSLLGALGVGLASETLLIPLVILVGFVGYYPLVIKREEAELLRLHKSEFEIYQKQVPKFFPKVSLLKEPEEYILKPMVFKRHLFNALWFIWLIGILEFIEGLHTLNVFPTIFKIF
jgi:protein-S-isoprenylcysteine O-methyltransferase Ste14